MKNLFKSLRFKIITLSVIGMLCLQVLIFAYVLPLFEDSFMQGQREKVKAAVDLGYSVIEHAYQKSQKGELPEKDAQELAKSTLRTMRFDTTDYYFVYNMQGIGVMHALNRKIEGENRFNTQDAKTGAYYLQEMISKAQTSEGGFVKYHFPKEKDGEPLEKVSFVRGHQQWGWFIGTGVYVDTVQAKIAAFRNRLLIAFYSLIFIVGGIAAWYSVRLSNSIRTIVSSLHDNARTVNDSIHVVSHAGQKLSETATSAAASLEETVASLEEITSMIRNNSDNSQQASQLALASRETALKGEEELRHLSQAMDDISASSKQIAEIIHVIDDIAFQTNLLALNAAVEAARAGEQGKGFAVVAEAVRSLAQRSSAAAKDINQLINDSSHKVQRGSEAATNSNEVLSKIMNSIKKTADLNSEIASASSEQTSGIQQINVAMNQLDQVTQGNAASSEEIAANVTEISKNISEVEKMVNDLMGIVDGKAS